MRVFIMAYTIGIHKCMPVKILLLRKDEYKKYNSAKPCGCSALASQAQWVPGKNVWTTMEMFGPSHHVTSQHCTSALHLSIVHYVVPNHIASKNSMLYFTERGTLCKKLRQSFCREKLRNMIQHMVVPGSPSVLTLMSYFIILDLIRCNCY